MMKNLINDLSITARKVSRFCLYFVVCIGSGFAAFMFIKVIVHMFVYVQTNWGPVWWIF